MQQPRPFDPPPLIQRFFQHARNNHLRVEVLLRQVAGQAALAVVVGRHGVETLRCFIDISETKESTAVGQKTAWPGVLNYDWLPTCQITKSPIADPCVLQTDTRGLHATEISERVLDI